jgi:hypothetical protein
MKRASVLTAVTKESEDENLEQRTKYKGITLF